MSQVWRKFGVSLILVMFLAGCMSQARRGKVLDRSLDTVTAMEKGVAAAVKAVCLSKYKKCKAGKKPECEKFRRCYRVAKNLYVSYRIMLQSLGILKELNE